MSRKGLAASEASESMGKSLQEVVGAGGTKR